MHNDRKAPSLHINILSIKRHARLSLRRLFIQIWLAKKVEDLLAHGRRDVIGIADRLGLPQRTHIPVWLSRISPIEELASLAAVPATTAYTALAVCIGQTDHAEAVHGSTRYT